MSTFQFLLGRLPGLQLISPFYAEDNRGSFMKFFEKNIFERNGIEMEVYETFFTISTKGTMRGLHFQRKHCQDKLVQVLRGSVYDVAVDLREDSKTFGQWEGVYLSAENRQMLYIPKGFAHGFLALENNTLFSYLCGDRYDPESDGGIRWDDPQLAISWPIDRVEQIIQSDKDTSLPTLEAFLRINGGHGLEGM